MTNKNKIIDKFAVVDLFCGIGGLTHGMEQAGFNVTTGVDFDISCEYAFNSNNRARFLHKNVSDMSGEELGKLYPEGKRKILVGCAPCQPFSTLNSKRVKHGFTEKDNKWTLLYSFAKLIEETQPDIVSMENVPSLKLFRDGAVLNEFIEILEMNRYHVTWSIVHAEDYGVPQKRRRLILFASKFGSVNLIKPTHQPENYKTVRQTIGQLPPLKDGEINNSDKLHRSRKLSDLNRLRIRSTSEGGGWHEWHADLVLDCHKKESGKTYGSVYGRMVWDGLAPTMTTQCTGLGNGRFGHPEQDRAISLREAALLQTFPVNYKMIDPGKSFSPSTIERHIGNAVPVLLGRVIGESIYLHIQDAYNR